MPQHELDQILRQCHLCAILNFQIQGNQVGRDTHPDLEFAVKSRAVPPRVREPIEDLEQH